jgi:multiple sugar transport system substrate-binding protein
VTGFRSSTIKYSLTLCGSILFLFTVLILGCNRVQRSGETPALNSTASAAITTSVITPRPTIAPVNTPAGPMILRLWVPPQFDPASSSPAGTQLQARLDQFTAVHPDVKIEVRVKAEEGPGGLLEALSTAGAAAPLVLPDVVALPRPLLEAAALKGLIHPFSDQPSNLDDPDWYPYARELGRLQNSTFGLPFAGNALVLVYRPGVVTQPPVNWASLLTASGPFIFPAADPMALFTLALYQSAGGPVQDENGRPVFDVNVLSQVLTFYKESAQAGLMPYTLTQYDTDMQIWTAYQTDQATMAITWISQYLLNRSTISTSRAVLLPTSNGAPFTLATGWMWALASTLPERKAIGAQLAEFLSTGDFLAEWSLAIGYLPPRASSTDAWADMGLRSLATQIGQSARSVPSADVLSSLGGPLSEAVIQVLKQQKDPLTAAQEAEDHLVNP